MPRRSTTTASGCAGLGRGLGRARRPRARASPPNSLEKNPTRVSYNDAPAVAISIILGAMATSRFSTARSGTTACGAAAAAARGSASRMTARELVPLLGRAPRLAPFLQAQARGVLAFDLRTAAGRSPTTGAASLEVEHGTEAKPCGVPACSG